MTGEFLVTIAPPTEMVAGLAVVEQAAAARRIRVSSSSRAEEVAEEPAEAISSSVTVEADPQGEGSLSVEMGIAPTHVHRVTVAVAAGEAAILGMAVRERPVGKVGSIAVGVLEVRVVAGVEVTGPGVGDVMATVPETVVITVGVVGVGGGQAVIET